MLGPALRLFVSALRGAALAAPLAIASLPAMAQDAYPTRPVKLIAPQAPGGGVDLVARIIAERLASRTGPDRSSSTTRRAPAARSRAGDGARAARTATR